MWMHLFDWLAWLCQALCTEHVPSHDASNLNHMHAWLCISIRWLEQNFSLEVHSLSGQFALLCMYPKLVQTGSVPCLQYPDLFWIYLNRNCPPRGELQRLSGSSNLFYHLKWDVSAVWCNCVPWVASCYLERCGHSLNQVKSQVAELLLWLPTVLLFGTYLMFIWSEILWSHID